ncbi:hypothetical protein F5Y16DRAFT_359654 [Xylariaceae sp. FL0255]|nr:hypothetical protein F5Y16DRAFT_359654 [Xylariaceae sp. FL0255]
MDAKALLTSQGWRGKGHTLHAHDDAIGLTNHILIKRNQDGSGLGSKKDHKAEAWWLNAFDQALKGIDVKSGTMKQTLKGGALEKIRSRGAAGKYTGVRGLYTSFVRGGVLEGSVKTQEPESATSASASLPTPSDSGVDDDAKGDKKKKDEKKDKESKDERRARREAKRLRKAEKLAQKEAEERAAGKVEKKKAKKAEREAEKERGKASETREERKVRRDARRKRKEEKRRLRAMAG